MIEVRQLDASEIHRYLSALGAVLVDCVQGGASVNFLLPFKQADGERFFESVRNEVANGTRILFAAFTNGELAGTVQVIWATPPNQPHRADIAKLLVRRSARSQGIGGLLMQHAEEAAQAAGRTLLVLDTANGAAERVYERRGWTRLGTIPRFAMMPDGSWCDTTVFWKDLETNRPTYISSADGP